MKKLAVVLVMLCCAFAPAAFASTLNPYTNAPVSVPNLGNMGSFTVLADTDAMHYTMKGDAGINTGTMVEHVDRNNSTGQLVFIYSFTVDPTSPKLDPNGVGRVTLSSYEGYTVDAGYSNVYCITPEFCPAVGDTAPDTMDRKNSGATIGFNFYNGVTAGHQSYELMLITNAGWFKSGSISLEDSGVAHLTGYAPAPAPELSSIALFGSGLLGFAGYARRRFLK